MGKIDQVCDNYEQDCPDYTLNKNKEVREFRPRFISLPLNEANKELNIVWEQVEVVKETMPILSTKIHKHVHHLPVWSHVCYCITVIFLEPPKRLRFTAKPLIITIINT